MKNYNLIKRLSYIGHLPTLQYKYRLVTDKNYKGLTVMEIMDEYVRLIHNKSGMKLKFKVKTIQQLIKKIEGLKQNMK